jgi:proteasome lid subunit RPN8/RPN11
MFHPITSGAPMTPARPAAWTDEVHEAAKAHAAECYPAEAAGIVERGQYVRLVNASKQASEDVFLDADDLLRVAGADLFFHSHPDGKGCPSLADMEYQRQLGIPFVVIVWPLYDVFWWGDELERAPLIGRGFRHGIHDCFSLIRDYYAERGIVLADQPRDWGWWSGKTPAHNYYLDNMEAAGFARITAAEATEPGDVLLMRFNYAVPMHGAVVWDRDLLLQHAAGQAPVDPTRLSSLVPRSRYIRHATVAARRK